MVRSEWSGQRQHLQSPNSLWHDAAVTEEWGQIATWQILAQPVLRGDEEITDSYAFKDSGSSWQLQNFQT